MTRPLRIYDRVRVRVPGCEPRDGRIMSLSRATKLVGVAYDEGTNFDVHPDYVHRLVDSRVRKLRVRAIAAERERDAVESAADHERVELSRLRDVQRTLVGERDKLAADLAASVVECARVGELFAAEVAFGRETESLYDHAYRLAARALSEGLAECERLRAQVASTQDLLATANATVADYVTAHRHHGAVLAERNSLRVAFDNAKRECESLAARVRELTAPHTTSAVAPPATENVRVPSAWRVNHFHRGGDKHSGACMGRMGDTDPYYRGCLPTCPVAIAYLSSLAPPALDVSVRVGDRFRTRLGELTATVRAMRDGQCDIEWSDGSFQCWWFSDSIVNAIRTGAWVRLPREDAQERVAIPQEWYERVGAFVHGVDCAYQRDNWHCVHTCPTRKRWEAQGRPVAVVLPSSLRVGQRISFYIPNRSARTEGTVTHVDRLGCGTMLTTLDDSDAVSVAIRVLS